MRKLSIFRLIGIFLPHYRPPEPDGLANRYTPVFPVALRDAGLSHKIVCFQCGDSLAALSLPLSRRDQCPNCSADLHICKMCAHYSPHIPRQCREDGAEDVKEKDRPNFCDWFLPSEGAFDPDRKSESDAAKDALEALFGGSDDT